MDRHLTSTKDRVHIQRWNWKTIFLFATKAIAFWSDNLRSYCCGPHAFTRYNTYCTWPPTDSIAYGRSSRTTMHGKTMIRRIPFRVNEADKVNGILCRWPSCTDRPRSACVVMIMNLDISLDWRDQSRERFHST